MIKRSSQTNTHADIIRALIRFTDEEVISDRHMYSEQTNDLYRWFDRFSRAFPLTEERPAGWLINHLWATCEHGVPRRVKIPAPVLRVHQDPDTGFEGWHWRRSSRRKRKILDRGDGRRRRTEPGENQGQTINGFPSTREGMDRYGTIHSVLK